MWPNKCFGSNTSKQRFRRIVYDGHDLKIKSFDDYINNMYKSTQNYGDAKKQTYT